MEIAAPEESAPAPVVSVKVQPASRRGDRKPAAELVQWELPRLKAGIDPLGQGLAQLFDKGVSAALFLAITPPPPGSPVPHFLASAAVLPRGADKTELWTGLKWDPTVVPELWNYFIRAGMVELSPPGTMTNITSNRNVVRGAFGVGKDEWLILVRAGTADSCRGVVALISRKTILPAVNSVLSLLQAAHSADKAAA
jgi:hypothetical protein